MQYVESDRWAGNGVRSGAGGLVTAAEIREFAPGLEACGHLLAQVMAQAMAGERPDVALDAFAPGRF
jgi:hypothetical protein